MFGIIGIESEIKECLAALRRYPPTKRSAKWNVEDLHQGAKLSKKLPTLADLVPYEGLTRDEWERQVSELMVKLDAITQ